VSETINSKGFVVEDMIALARSVIDKYGADAEKPSVYLARALLDGAHERDTLLATVARLEKERDWLQLALKATGEQRDSALAECDRLKAENERMRAVYVAAFLICPEDPDTKRDEFEILCELEDAHLRRTGDAMKSWQQCLVARAERSAPECSSSWIGHLTKPALLAGVGKARFDAGTLTKTMRAQLGGKR